MFSCEPSEVKEARNAFKKSNYIKAYSHYKKIIADNTSAQVFFEFGLICFQLKKYKEAKEAFLAATKIKPDYVEAFIGLGKSCFIRTEWDEAENAYKNAIANEPEKFPEVYYHLGFLYEFNDKLNEAEQAYLKTIKLDPVFADAYKNLATVYLKQIRYKEAGENYNKYKEILRAQNKEE